MAEICLGRTGKDWDSASTLLTNHGLCIDEKATGSAAYELGCQIPLVV
ncbi:hypothetical protein SC1083_2077 [Aggregatibacter actinomycetemcomitans serotype e str. SC1083]|uniref:Uncharacterized protein n=1 Tax=Aggregatibacter actinomycetemcomitans serotype e str. SC1083 TaxID=907488 RepID=G4AB44_AGGAC|nr:hypothetical protein SC1083_2077 [Aggregatibacter actinomycetemcomitans serotype e str. SC1083]